LGDYAYVADPYLSLCAVIDKPKPGSSGTWMKAAKEKVDFILSNHRDPQAVGFFTTAKGPENRIPQKKEWFDNSIPSPNSVLLHVFGDLYALTGHAQYSKELESLKIAYPGLAERAPAAITHALHGIAKDALGVAVIKAKVGEDELKELRTQLSNKPWRRTFLLHSTEDDQPEGFQLCVKTQCLAPTRDIGELLESI